MGIPPVPGIGLLENLAASGGRTAAAPIHPAELQSLQSQNALRAQETSGLALSQAIQQRQLQDQDVIRRAYVNTSGDPNEVRDYAIKNGISGSGLMGWQQHAYDLQTKAAELRKTDIANQTNLHERQIKLHDEAGNIIDSINAIKDPTQQQAAYAQNVGRLQQLAPDVQWADPAKYTPDQGQFYSGVLGHAKAVLDRTKTQADIDQSKATAAKDLAETGNKTVTTADGVFQFNPQTGKYDVKVGPPPKHLENESQTDQQGNVRTRTFNPATGEYGPWQNQGAIGKPNQQITVANSLGGDALDLMAHQALNGTFTSRNPAVMAKVYGRASEIAKGMGLDSQAVIMAQNGAKADREALNAVTKQYETLKPFAEMAEKNADLLEKRASEISDLGAGLFNTPLRDIENKFGSAKVAAFKAALMPVQADFARILNSPTGSGELTDTARHEMQQAIGAGATVGQIKAALDVFRTDAKNRKQAYEEAVSGLKQRSVVGAPQPATPAPATRPPLGSFERK